MYNPRQIVTLTLGIAFLFSGCADSGDFPDGGASDAAFVDGSKTCSKPDEDWDNDGLTNGEEGCLQARDSDYDGIPDWQDSDSDGDKVSDALEVGEKDSEGKCASGGDWPCDTDKDNVPDYLDIDSDGDGLKDGDEDSNGDGMLGCCVVECGKPGVLWQAKACILTDDGCGLGQECVAGMCTPKAGFKCSNGETSPVEKDTFGDGKIDTERGTFICRDATESKPQGRKEITTRDNADGNWNVAFEADGSYSALTLVTPADKEAAAVIDLSDSQAEVAGFVISRGTTIESIHTELTDITAGLTASAPGGSGTLTVRASGAERTTHDGYDGVHDTILDLALGSASNVSTIRNEVIASLMGKSPAELGTLPGPFGSSNTDFVLRMVTVRRFDKDNPTDQSKWRLLVMGAVASKFNYADPARRTGFIVDDLSNGTGLATADDTVVDECDVAEITSLPVADIIWVVDESGSMDDERDNIVKNANEFFSRALASGLDFRMGVTNVCDEEDASGCRVGKFCSKISTDDHDDGGQDRFLLPSEQSIFDSCIRNPPGYEGGSEYGLVNAKEAVLKHLPRAYGAPDKIRPEAKIVIIVATDEVPQSMSSDIGYSNFDVCKLPADAQTKVDAKLTEYKNLFSGVTDPEAAALFHVIGGGCNTSCDYNDVAHGYKDLAQALGGQLADICQTDLGATLQVIIESVIGLASPVVLEYVPISTSLAVALDGKQTTRSRTNGFDYRASANSLAFINVKFEKGSEVIASYKRWKKQDVVK
jgi:hypothetical protein